MPPVDVDVSDRIARVTLNAPPLNILTSAVQDRLRTAMTTLRGTENFNAMFLLSGIAGKFSAGADVGEHIGRDNCRRMLKSAHGLIAEVLRCPVPTLCFVDGPCLGGAFELALSCDQIIATTGARFGTPEIQLGCYPPAALALMPSKLPALVANELIQSGQPVGAARIGARITEDLPSEIEVLAAHYATLPRGPLVEATRLLRSGAAERFMAQVGGIEQAYLERLLSLHDATEGPEAFLAKRKPDWDHRTVGGTSQGGAKP